MRPVGPASVVTNGGDVLLIARNGDVRQAAGGQLNVAAGSTSGRAGSLGIFAGGTLALDGALAGDGPDFGPQRLRAHLCGRTSTTSAH